MKSYNLEAYIIAGCLEMEYPAMIGVHEMTEGRVCDTGCHAFNSGNCKAYKNLIKGHKAVTPDSETVRNEAKRRGISISEVRRQRHKRIRDIAENE